jgi:hypothetical protein
MIGEDLGVALVATPEPPSEGFGAAGLDVGDGAPVLSRITLIDAVAVTFFDGLPGSASRAL